MRKSNEVLKERRKEKGLTQVEVACKSNISARYYQCLEAGTSMPRVGVAKQVAKTLNSTIEELFPRQ